MLVGRDNMDNRLEDSVKLYQNALNAKNLDIKNLPKDFFKYDDTISHIHNSTIKTYGRDITRAIKDAKVAELTSSYLQDKNPEHLQELKNILSFSKKLSLGSTSNTPDLLSQFDKYLKEEDRNKTFLGKIINAVKDVFGISTENSKLPELNNLLNSAINSEKISNKIEKITNQNNLNNVINQIQEANMEVGSKMENLIALKTSVQESKTLSPEEKTQALTSLNESFKQIKESDPNTKTPQYQEYIQEKVTAFEKGSIPEKDRELLNKELGKIGNSKEPELSGNKKPPEEHSKTETKSSELQR